MLDDKHDWEADERPLSECLKDFERRINGGKVHGAREAGRQALRIKSIATYNGLHAGRVTPYEATIRRMMTLIVGLDGPR